MKIGIIGLGMVGGTILSASGIFGSREKVIGYDTYKGIGSLDDVTRTDAIFVCVPTPTKGDAQDFSEVKNTLSELQKKKYSGIIIVKSTIVPGTMDELQETYTSLDLAHNPEFLRERTCLEDFVNQKTVLVSSKSEKLLARCEGVYSELYHDHPKPEMSLHLDFKTTEIAKYIHNTFLATKVSFMNQVYEYCKDINTDYSSAVKAAVSQGVVGGSHTQVPGPDGQFGFGGACFPKDTLALLSTDSHGRLTILKEATVYNDAVRNKI